MSLQFPVLGEVKTTVSGIKRFGGLNRNLRIADGEFHCMENISSELLPVVSVRKPRRRVRSISSPGGLFCHDKLCWVSGGSLYYHGAKVAQVQPGEKTFARMGAYLLVWPDKLCYDTEQDRVIPLENTFAASDTVAAGLCRLDGGVYEGYTVSDKEPSGVQSGALWLDTSSGEESVLRQYSAASGLWTALPSVYTRISAKGLGKGFKKHDGVTISGFEDERLSGSFYLAEVGEDFVIIPQIIKKAVSQKGGVVIKRTVPDMDFITEHDNRLWGCSNKNREIYASALGDPTNFNQFMGLSSDSYALSVGSPGDFTGAVSHQGQMLFFKENCIHQVLGVRPANYQMETLHGRGVAKGSERSLVRVGAKLMYLSPEDVCCFQSTLPQSVSDALGTVHLTAGAAGEMAGRYYLSAKDETGQRSLFVFDMKQGVWVREDQLPVTHFARLGQEMYMLCENGELWNCCGSNEYDDETACMEEKVEWLLETGDLGLDTPQNRYISALQLCGECGQGSSLRVEMQTGLSDEWRQVYHYMPNRRMRMVIPIIPERGRALRLRLSGEGRFRLYSITMRVEKGSDVYGD